ncbi:glycosyltransferase [Fluviibacter phosphoraccumulans]|uniref:Glycosyl transferase family 1 domain-containing protein n=1 Tax=Fluviibacter phosphoraccumulans TaxID=1751046 RepID=A0A7R6QZE9_9RHOO|nr:glycosyltransferase [Fluviibacter phosphoraccumulans]BBU67995.1 hypothetical protein ICHIAU1_02780 [Fluviibacter phosphoraccumulans]BBU70466.1 hypothetical protein ICHIJ1_03850 [Fluviibacter phosphoraccumulans]
MRLFLLFHDAALPHSRYLLEGFAANSRVAHLTVAYPEGRGADLIFSAGADCAQVASGYRLVGLKSSRLREKWVRFRALVAAVREARPDYVIVLDEGLYPNTLMAGAAVRLAGLNVPVVFYGFENISQTPPWAWLKAEGIRVLVPFLRKTVRYLLLDKGLQFLRKQLVAGGLVSYVACEDMIRQAGWNVPLKEQWWGVDTGLFKQAALRAQERPVAWHVNSTQRVIGFVGRFVPEKGVIDLLQALGPLGSDYVLVCIGGGPQEIELREQAQTLGVAKQLRILPPMPASELAEHIAAMDVLALPSHSEQFWKEQYGRVLVEAMAAGVPVIGSNSGAIPYVIGDSRCVFVEGDIAGICKAVNVAEGLTATEREELQSRASRGDISTFVQAYINLYDELQGTC